MAFEAGACRLMAGVLVDPWCKGNSVRCLSPTCSIGEGPGSSQGAMSAREVFACDVDVPLPGETAGSASSLCKHMSVNVFGSADTRLHGTVRDQVRGALRPANTNMKRAHSRFVDIHHYPQHRFSYSWLHQMIQPGKQTYPALLPDFNFPNCDPDVATALTGGAPGPLTVSVDR